MDVIFSQEAQELRGGKKGKFEQGLSEIFLIGGHSLSLDELMRWIQD